MTTNERLPDSNIAENDVPIDATSSDEDEAYASASPSTTISTYATSISSYIWNGVEENGRRYPAYGKHLYGLPVDEREQERNDLQHAKFNLLIGDRLHSAPIGESPSKILDLGTGSGIWAIDMADRYERAQVTGVDIAPVQTAWVPVNCSFEVLDIEEEWLLRKESFDFVHARELLLSVRDWDRLCRQAYEHVKPGGWFEVSASYPLAKSNDGTLTENSSLLEMQRLFFEIGERMGTPVDAPRSYKAQFQQAGFVDVVEQVIEMPQGPWPQDETLKKIGELENYSLTTGLEAYLLRGYTSFMGGDPAELRAKLIQTYKELADPKLHSHIFYYNVYGRKSNGPLQAMAPGQPPAPD